MKCRLRQEVEEIIRQKNSDATASALEICVYLDDVIGLAGNGWFDHDSGNEDEQIRAALQSKNRKVYWS